MQQLNLLPSQPHKPLELRDYQKQMKRDIYAHIKADTNRILVYGPTGSGKTLVLSSVLQDALSKGRRCLLLVHRDFLVEQTMQTLLNLGVEGDRIGIIKAGYTEDRTRPLQIAGLQTLNNRPVPEGIDLLTEDECHTTAFWTGTERIKEAMPNAIKLGYTASPWRLKPHIEYFGQHYDAIVRGPSIKELIKRGHLSEPRCYGWGGLVNYKRIKSTRQGDFRVGEMEQEFIAAKIPEAIVNKIQEFAEGRTGIIFNSGCQQSQLQTELLNKAGILTAHVDADTPVNERRRIYARLETGEIQCISSVGCLTEGFDVRSMSFIVLARATKSRALYVQMCGRGLRSFPGKENCVILDFGGNVTRLGHLTTDWDVTLDQKESEELNSKTTGEDNTSLKECEVCGYYCHHLVRICPKCGFNFPPKSNKFGDVSKKVFGELVDAETMEMIDYAQSQRKTRYTKNHPPDKLWFLFREKYGETAFFNNRWIESAIFDEQFPLANQQRFLDYLEKWMPQTKWADKWVQFHAKIEFPECDYVERLTPWEVLEISENSSLLEAKTAYRKAVESIEIDREQVELLNWAGEKLGFIKP